MIDTFTAEVTEENSGRKLLPQPFKLIADSAISRTVAESRDYSSVETKSSLNAICFSPSQCNVPALLIPLYNVHRELAGYQSRPDHPRTNKKNGKLIKYETLAGMRMLVDVHPSLSRKNGDTIPPIADTSKALWITEGVRKGLRSEYWTLLPGPPRRMELARQKFRRRHCGAC
jgi:hypothetical protein